MAPERFGSNSTWTPYKLQENSVDSIWTPGRLQVDSIWSPCGIVGQCQVLQLRHNMGITQRTYPDLKPGNSYQIPYILLIGNTGI